MPTKQQLKDLRYKSYEELKLHAKIDPKAIRILKKFDLKKCCQNFFELESNARLKSKEGDEEEAFILYCRAIEVYDVISKKMDAVFKRNEEAKNLYNKLIEVENETTTLLDNLKLRYGEQKPFCLEDSCIFSAVDLTKGKEQDAPTSRSTIKPVELIHFIENKKAFVLILDYRTNQNRYIKYKSKVGKMDIVQLVTSTIVPGCLLNSLIKTLDIGFRPYLEQISQYDMVVILGDRNDMDKPTRSKTNILRQALTTYNTRRPLKKSPLTTLYGYQTLVTMQDGFEAWECAYPCYVADKSERRQSYEQTFDEKFAMWIHESKQVNKLNINYPDLFTNKDEIPTHLISEKPDSTYNKSSTQMAIKKSTSDFPLLQETVSDNARKITDIVKVPEIDRTKKPTTNNFNYSNQHINEMINSKTDEVSIPSKIHYDPNEIVTRTDRRLALPQIQILGGARVAAITDEAKTNGDNKPSTNQVQVQQPSRVPPTPNRSLKNSVIQQPGQAKYYYQAYEMAISKISGKSKCSKTKPGCVGLENLGNTCFMNATLQALFHTPVFSHLFRSKNVARWIDANNEFGTKGIISGCFSALVDLAYSGEFSIIYPSFFLEIFAQRVNSTLADRKQHDAQEFQIYLLDALHEDTNRVNKRVPFEQNYTDKNLSASANDFFERTKMFTSSPVNDIFNLTTVSMLRCNLCKGTSVCFEGLNQISIELPQTNQSVYGEQVIRLSDCLKTHFSETNLDAQWDCPSCKCKQNATRMTNIWSVPKILIIHLKRFSFTGGRFVKNEIHVDFDIDDFQLTNYMHQEALKRNARYNLYAVTNHSGTLNSGHYTTIAKNCHNNSKSEWLYFNDASYTILEDLTTIMSNQAFLLYYSLDQSEL